MDNIPPKNMKKSKYSDLFKNTLQHIKKLKTIMWKVKSHTIPYEQPYNRIADELAEMGRLDGNNNYFMMPPPFNSFCYSTVTRNHYNAPFDRNTCVRSIMGCIARRYKPP